MSKTTLKMIIALGIIGAITSDAMYKTGNMNFDGSATIKADINTNVIFDGEYTNKNNTSDSYCTTLESISSTKSKAGSHMILSGEPTVTVSQNSSSTYYINVINQDKTCKDIFKNNIKCIIKGNTSNITNEYDISNTKNNTALNALSGKTPGGSIVETNFGTITEEFLNDPLSNPLPNVSEENSIYVELIRSIMFGCSLTAIETSMATRKALINEQSVSQPYFWITDDSLRDALTTYDNQKKFIAFMSERSTNAVARACMNYNLANYKDDFDIYTFGEAILPVMTADGLYKNPPEDENLYNYIGNVSCPEVPNVNSTNNITTASGNGNGLYYFPNKSFLQIYSSETKNLSLINCCMQTCVYSIESNLNGSSCGTEATSPYKVAFSNYNDDRSLEKNLIQISTQNNIGIAKEQTNINNIIQNFDVKNYYDTYNNYRSFDCIFKRATTHNWYFNTNIKYDFSHLDHGRNVYSISDAMEILSLESTIDTVCSLGIDKIQGSNEVLMQLLYKPLGGTFADINNKINNSHNKKLDNFKKRDAYLCLTACKDYYDYVPITFGTSYKYLLFRGWSSMNSKIIKLAEKIFGTTTDGWWNFDSANSANTQAELPTTDKEFLFSQALYYYIYSTVYDDHQFHAHRMAQNHCLAASKACFLAMLGADVTKVNEIITIAHNNIWKCIDDQGGHLESGYTSIDPKIIFIKLIELSDTVSPTLSHCFKAHSMYRDVYCDTDTIVGTHDECKSKINTASMHIRNFMDSASKNAPYLCNVMDFSRRLLTYLSCAANSVKCYMDHNESSNCCDMQRDAYNLYYTRDIYLNSYPNSNNNFVKEILGYDTSSRLLTRGGKLNDLMNALTSDPVMYNERLKYGFRNYVGLVDSILNEQCVYNIRPDLNKTLQPDTDQILLTVTNNNTSDGSGINKVIHTVTNMVFDAYQIAPYNDLTYYLIDSSNNNTPMIFNADTNNGSGWQTTPTRFSKDGKNNIDPSVKDFVIALRGLGNVNGEEKIIFSDKQTVKFSTQEIETFLIKYGDMLNVLKDKTYAFPTQSAYRQYINASIASYNTIVENKSTLGILNNFQKINFMPEKSSLVIKKDGNATAIAYTSEVARYLLNHVRFGPKYDLYKTYEGIPLHQIFADQSKSIVLKDDAPGYMHISNQKQKFSTKLLQETGYTAPLPMIVELPNNAEIEMFAHTKNNGEIPAYMELYLNPNSKVNITGTGTGNYENKTLSYNKSANDEKTSTDECTIKPRAEFIAPVTINNITINKGVNIGTNVPITLQGNMTLK